jgi:hypothetical protein
MAGDAIDSSDHLLEHGVINRHQRRPHADERYITHGVTCAGRRRATRTI